MIDILLEPFSYKYMNNAIWISTLVGYICAFLSAYLTLKGWSLIGDALSHSIIPGVVVANMVGLPFSICAFISGGLASGAMVLIKKKTHLQEDAVIGIIFTSFFSMGLFILSLYPSSINIHTILFGNVLAITKPDTLQVLIISAVTLAVLILKWRDFMILFFDENHAQSIGMNTNYLKILFFTLLSASTIAAFQTVGAFLVIAMVVTPGATAYLLTKSFGKLIIISSIIGAVTSFSGAYISYFLNCATGGIIVVMQTIFFFWRFL
ncbi:Manganese ABC transporter, inner membrane permease protein SitC [Liberibacter crescens BT-1]|uniref:Manganese ABC transporter, inner membrane permease protein SitC n=1 Tax=Liberibacter crescens (strain BT-1) TaxID=1215343 RepID=L0EWJ9_LIBCB|nr:metal ABC transporter permease [Liberibacter crescens]AGA65008.1 Manganese ABC transporter, inner membrane permease protein SitC [Liberibacter crescens BT-1]